MKTKTDFTPRERAALLARSLLILSINTNVFLPLCFKQQLLEVANGKRDHIPKTVFLYPEQLHYATAINSINQLLEQAKKFEVPFEPIQESTTLILAHTVFLLLEKNSPDAGFTAMKARLLRAGVEKISWRDMGDQIRKSDLPHSGNEKFLLLKICYLLEQLTKK